MSLDLRISRLVVGQVRSNRITIEGAVVIGADTSNVDSVFIAGRAMKRHGQVLHVDLDRVRTLALASRDSVVASSGFGGIVTHGIK